MRGTRVVVAAVAVLAAAAGVVSWVNRPPDPEPAARRFADGIAAGSVDPLLLTDPALGEPARMLVAAAAEELGGLPRVVLGPVERGQVERGQEQRASVRADVRWPLALANWTYSTSVPLRLVDGAWRVEWSPAVLHPQLRPGQSFDVRFAPPPRATILAADGRPLVSLRPIVTVGIEPRRVRDLDATLRALVRSVPVEAEPLRERVQAAAPDEFVEVIALRREDYVPLRGDLRPIPGVVFREGERQLAPTPTFARALLGRVGPATEEVLAEAGPGFGPGDELGLSGLQREFQRQLAGRPGVGVGTVGADGRPAATLHRVPAEPGRPMRTTLDPAAQVAAEAALSRVTKPWAVVAVRPSTGAVLAVANGPDGGGAEGGAAGRVPFALAFAESCNTTVAPLAVTLPDRAVAAAAESFGFGGDWSPGTAAFTGEVPPPEDPVERAAEAIGQGRVLASPLVMAGVAAAVADGTWRPPTLLPDSARPGAGPRPLDRSVATSLRGLLGGVVTEGTGGALAAVAGPPVRAKTGTAEFGSAVPPRTHAWVIGAQGDLAFAVLVTDGGGGGAVAAPLAARFLAALPPGSSPPA